jgi:hypothetical protein
MMVRVKAGAMCASTKQLTILINRLKETDDFINQLPAVANGIANIRQAKTSIVIANLTNGELNIPKGTKIATCRVVNGDDFETKNLGNTEDTTSGKDSRMINLIQKDVLAITKEPEWSSCPTCQKDTTKHSNQEWRDCLLKYYQLPRGMGIDSKNLNKQQIIKLVMVISGYKQVFAEDPKAPGHVDPQVAEHIIDTGNNLPINMGPRRSSPAQREIIRKYINELLSAGIITEARSPWSSPILLVPHPENTEYV